MATARKSYTNSRTGAVRLSSSPLGFPFVPTPKDAPADADADKGAADKGASSSKSGDAKDGK